MGNGRVRTMKGTHRLLYKAASIPDAPRQSWHSSVNGHRVQRTVVRSTSPAAHHNPETRCAEAMLRTQRRNYLTTRSPYKQRGRKKRRKALRKQCRNGRESLPTRAPDTAPMCGDGHPARRMVAMCIDAGGPRRSAVEHFDPAELIQIGSGN